jgi:tetratricopeptide (TPR) repeat protein
LQASQKKYDEADKLFEQALTKDPRDISALTGLVQIRLIHKQPALAGVRVDQQIARVPNDSSLYLLKGQIEMARKDPAAAEGALKKAVELNPRSIDAILALTSVQLSRGSVVEATASYQRAIQQDPQDIRAYILLGSLEDSQGKWQAAQQHYQDALKVQSDNPAAANNLAYSLLEHGGNVDVALSLAQTARRAMPDVPNTADTLAWAYINKGVYGLAIDLLQQAIKASPNDATYYYHLGVAYEKSNDRAHAKAQFERALHLNPPDSLAGAIRKMLAESAGS